LLTNDEITSWCRSVAKAPFALAKSK